MTKLTWNTNSTEATSSAGPMWLLAGKRRDGSWGAKVGFAEPDGRMFTSDPVAICVPFPDRESAIEWAEARAEEMVVVMALAIGI